MTADPRVAVPPLSFARLARVELAKAVDTRSARCLLGLALLGILLALPLDVSAPSDYPPGPANLIHDGGQIVAMALTIVAVLLVTTEWTQRTKVVTFIQEPRRLRLLAAKAAACVILALILAALCDAAAFGALAVGAALGHEVSWSPSAQAGWLFAYLPLMALLGFALATLIQETAGAIVILFLGPGLIEILAVIFRLPDAFQGSWVAPIEVFNQLTRPGDGGNWSQIGVAALAWIVVPSAAGALRTLRRDLS